MQKLLKQSEKYIKYLATAIFIVIPLYPKFPSLRIPGAYVSVRLEDFLILGVLLLLIPIFLREIKTIFANPVARAIILFLFVGFVSTLSGLIITRTVIPNIGILHWIRRIEYLSMFFVGFVCIYKSNNKNIFGYFIKVLLLVNLALFIYGLGQRYLDFPVIITQNEEYSKGIALRWVPGSHINSTFAGHYDLASYLVLTMPIFITSFFILKDKISKIILSVSILFGFWLLSFAVSRISIVAFFVSGAVALYLLKKYKEIILLTLVSIIIFGFSADLRVRYNRIFQVLKEKIASVIVVEAAENEVVFEDRSTSIRLNVEWPRAIRAFSKNPLIGMGYSSITLATDNEYLRALGEIGLLGLLSFILILARFFQSTGNIILSEDIHSAFVAGFIGSVVGILITAVFIDIFEASKFAIIYWLMAGIVVGKSARKGITTTNE